MAKTACDAPFIGGAEKARRNARKRNSNSSATSCKRQHRASPRPFPKSMRPYDRFFGSLLSSSLICLADSQIDEGKHRELMERGCLLLDVPSLPAASVASEFQQSKKKIVDTQSEHLLQKSSSFLTHPASLAVDSTVPSSSGTFDNARTYYLSKAPLILEESRYIIADALNRLSWQKNSMCSLTLKLLSVEEKYPQLTEEHILFAPMIVNFSIERISNAKDISWSRPGSIFILRRYPTAKLLGTSEKCNQHIELQSSLLACVAPSIQKKSESNDSLHHSRISNLGLMIFRQNDLNISTGVKNSKSNASSDPIMFQAIALTTLISQVRQMEACLRMTKVAFMPKLLGCKKSKHIRFYDPEEEDIVVGDVSCEEAALFDEKTENLDSETKNETQHNVRSLLEKLPQLNATQEKAASCFLNSLPSSLILVQGPPGTGKSTFLVNVICRRLAIDPNSRLLVTAPTNRAVIVLAQRFLDAIKALDNSTINDSNPILVGVEDKLILNTFDRNGTDYFLNGALPMSLRSIFVYTWLESVKVEWLALSNEMENVTKADCKPSNATLESLANSARRIHRKLLAGVPMTSSECIRSAKKVIQNLKAAEAAIMLDISTEDTISSFINQAMSHTRCVHMLLNAIDPSNVVPELLSRARVIFCTLSTSGASIIKQMPQVDDLLVDEAAAATEAEICIPFHLRPKRMMAVGDPMQLPPTIMSRRAADLGLSKSMHERLMNECNEDYFMLDRQYRMVPSISHFPRKQFYNGSVLDGENVMSNSYATGTFLSVPKPYLFIHVCGIESRGRCGSYVNNDECAKIVEIVANIWEKSKDRDLDWDSHDKLRIITFYQAQMTLLKTLLAKRNFHNVLVATVDSSQGCEADTVIVSFTRSNNNKGVRRAAGFLSDDRRINVALTRGKHQLICVGNASTLGSEGSEALKQLVLDAKERGCIR